jgi:hypothetical protein
MNLSRQVHSELAALTSSLVYQILHGKLKVRNLSFFFHASNILYWLSSYSLMHSI